MSSKFCISINEEKNPFNNTKGKASKVAANAVTKVYRRKAWKNGFNTEDKALKKAAKAVRKKALRNGSSVLVNNNPPNRCNNGNPGYVDGGGDKKNEKNQFAEDSFLVVQSYSNVVSEVCTIDHQKVLSDSLSFFKKSADFAEENARNCEKRVQYAIELASNKRVRAEEMRKIIADQEKSVEKVLFLVSNTSDRGMLTDSLFFLRELAVNAEENAKISEMEIQYAKEQASYARVRAEEWRKIFADGEKSISETLLKLSADTLPGMKKSADLPEESARNYKSILAGMTP